MYKAIGDTSSYMLFVRIVLGVGLSSNVSLAMGAVDQIGLLGACPITHHATHGTRSSFSRGMETTKRWRLVSFALVLVHAPK